MIRETSQNTELREMKLKKQEISILSPLTFPRFFLSSAQVFPDLIIGIQLEQLQLRVGALKKNEFEYRVIQNLRWSPYARYKFNEIFKFNHE